MPTILLIDGSNYLFRAFHALPPLATSKGEPTGAIKGFQSMLKTVHGMVKPDFAVCVFDAPGKNFRHEIYSEYKANRPPMPEELRVQIDPIFEMVKLLGWPLVQVPGVEADDVLATLARKAVTQGMKVVIATGDKDLAQLVDSDITLVNTMSRSRLDVDGVFQKYGVRPDQIIDYLALMGDKVDNVPGINKCGPKTAAKWLAEYDTLENIVKHADEIKGKIGEYLRAGIPFLDIAKRLVTIKLDADIQLDVDHLVISPVDASQLDAFFARWEMRAPARSRSVSKPSKSAPTPEPVLGYGQGDLFAMPTDASTPALTQTIASDDGFVFVKGDHQLSELAGLLKQAEHRRLPVSVALLTDRECPMHDVSVGLGIAITPNERYFVPTASEQELESARHYLAGWMAGSGPKLFHDAKYARHVLANMQMPVGEQAHDTMLMSYVNEAHLKHDMQKLAARYLSMATANEDDFLGKGAARTKVANMPVGQTARYLTTQAALNRVIGAVLLSRLTTDTQLGRIYEDLELKVSRVLWQMERTGVMLDTKLLHQQSQELGEQIDSICLKIDELAQEKFNPASPKQLGRILFEKLHLPVKKKTASGAPSTDEEVLTELALDYPLPKYVLQYRQLAKLKSTYTDKLPQMVDDADGRIHTTFGQATAVTGRLASSEPNLQNIPVRTAEGRRVREAFVAPAGCKILSADYSQIELRIMAHISGDPGLLAAFREGRDIHRATAAEVFGVSLDQVTADQRRMAKVINFGLIYGMSAFGLAQNLGVERSVATHYIGEYFARYPMVAQYMDTTRLQARQNGFVETAFGRRLWLPDIKSSRAPVRAGAERAAINAPMQGTAADLIKMAMVAVQQWITEQGLRSKLVLQVHDELILEVPCEEIELVQNKVPELMASVAQLAVPLIAEVGVADNWEAAH